MTNIAYLVLVALILANTMLIFDIWYHLFVYNDTEVKKCDEKSEVTAEDSIKNEIEEKHTCKTCMYNSGLFCSNPQGNCYDSKDAETKWKPITKKGGEE